LTNVRAKTSCDLVLTVFLDAGNVLDGKALDGGDSCIDEIEKKFFILNKILYV